jgi:hypothetical protein
MNNAEPFAFYTERRLVMLTGRKAQSLSELLEHIRQVSGSSIFYHTHQQYLSHHFEKPVFHNDFANWASLALLEEELSEKLIAIDFLAFSSIRELRDEIIKTIETYLLQINGRQQICLPGQEFHFCESKSFIMSSGLIAQNIPDFFAKLPRVANTSMYYHFFESRLRLERPANDFTSWLSYRGATELAQAIDQLNPYQMTMDELREAIIQLGKERS